MAEVTLLGLQFPHLGMRGDVGSRWTGREGVPRGPILLSPLQEALKMVWEQPLFPSVALLASAPGLFPLGES